MPITKRNHKKIIGNNQEMPASGYHVGPTVDHNNHYLTFECKASSRTIALATKLDPKSIAEAFREMKFWIEMLKLMLRSMKNQ
jgi:hypothetical protein